MEWFYSKENSQHGPVSAYEILELEATGEIDTTTLVWTETIVDWRPLGQIRKSVVAAALDEKPELAECSVSGKLFPRTVLLQFGEKWVHPDHKSGFVQSLAEDAPLPRLEESETELGAYGYELKFGAVFRRAWDLYSKNFGLITLIMILVWIIPDQVICLIQEKIPETGDFAQDFNKENKVDRLFEGLIGIISAGAIFQLCFLRDRGITPLLGECFGTAFKHWGRMWLANFLLGAVIFGIIFATFIPIAVMIPTFSTDFAPVSIGISTLLGIIGICALIFYVIRFLLAPAIVIEGNTTTTGAMRASYRMTKSLVWRIIGYIFVIGMAIGVIAITMFIPTAFPPLDHWSVTGILATISGIFEAFFTVFVFALYRQIQISLPTSEAGLL